MIRADQLLLGAPDGYSTYLWINRDKPALARWVLAWEIGDEACVNFTGITSAEFKAALRKKPRRERRKKRC